MAKQIRDPFENVPPIEEDEGKGNQPAQSPAKAATKPVQKERKGAPRTLFKNGSKYLVPLAAAAILAWIFLGDTKSAGEKLGPAKETAVDPTRIRSDTNSILNALKGDADRIAEENDKRKKAEAAAAAAAQPPASSSTLPDPMARNPVTNPQDFGAAQQAAERQLEDERRREEEILASPLEAQGGSFKLFGADNAPGGDIAAGPKARLNQAQMEIDALNKRRAEADTRGSDRTAEVLAKMAAAEDGQAAAQRRSSNDAFLVENANSDTKIIVLKQQAPTSNYVVFQGTPIPTVLLSGINSDLPGDVTALVTSDVYDSIHRRFVLIPQYSRLFGKYNHEIAVGQKRVLVAMNRLLLPNGTWVPLGGARGTDLLGRSGMPANVNNHFMEMFGTSLVLGAASYLLPSRDRNITTTGSGNGQTTSGGSVAGMALNDTLKTVLERNKVMSPTLTIEPGQQFLFVAAHDMAMVPYRR